MPLVSNLAFGVVADWHYVISAKRTTLKYRIICSICVLMLLALPATARQPAPLPTWRDVVTATPYWESQGVYTNLKTIRRWVLAGKGYCSERDRHVLFDRRMRFLGYLTDAGAPESNQNQIDNARLRLAQTQRVTAWVPGALNQIGYPFVLSCNQPHAHLPDLLARYLGDVESARLWGTWDGIRVGAEDQPVSLHDAIREVYEQRRGAGRIKLPEGVLGILAGKVIIESGGVRHAQSPAGARGILQLSQAALDDCGLEQPFQLHRLAQIDCALYLLEQNQRNLEPTFREYFGHLPDQKAARLLEMLLIQAYHGGVGRVNALMNDESLNGPAKYFASHAERFSAGDIALGMVFHNLGRERLGFATLYYVADVTIAIEAVCASVKTLPGCA